jgi:DNA ligase-1
MDIRNFFSSSSKEVGKKVISNHKRRLVVSDDESNELEFASTEISECYSNSVIRDENDSNNCDSTILKPESGAHFEILSNYSYLFDDQQLKNSITWKPNDDVPYKFISEIFEAISCVSGRIEKENLLCTLFTAILITTPRDLDIAVYLTTNTVAPAYENVELGIGDSLLVRAICEATGRKKDAVEDAYEKEGDLGTVALTSRANQQTLGFLKIQSNLSARHVLEQLRLIAQIKVQSDIDRSSICEVRSSIPSG